MSADEVLIHDVAIGHEHGFDVRIAAGRIVAIETKRAFRSTPDQRVLNGQGGLLLPGLHDHHIHLFGLAAHYASVQLDAHDTAAAMQTLLQQKAAQSSGQQWLRATGYEEAIAGAIDRATLDRLMPNIPLRVQYSTGTLWVFNSAGLAQLAPLPADPLERNPAGRLTGRLWHGDAWLKSRLAPSAPDFGAVGRLLAGFGITGVTDASPGTGPAEVALLAAAHRDGHLPQRLMLMSAGPLAPDASQRYTVGPVKIMLHEAHLPAWEHIVQRVKDARVQQRSVAWHCVTLTEVAYALAVLDEAGVGTGDRIEHGAVLDPPTISALAERGLTVVTQPAFIEARGDRYLRDVDACDIEHLYRCASLVNQGVRIAASSDAPYGNPDPWAAMSAAQRRRTRRGHTLNVAEALTPMAALDLFLGAPHDPGGPPRRLAVGQPADLCLMQGSLADVLHDPRSERVSATLIGGTLAYQRVAARHDTLALQR